MDDTMQDPTFKPGGPPTSCSQPGENLAIPSTDIISFAFSRLDQHDPNQVIYADADDATCNIRAGDIRPLVACLSADLRIHGVQRGDCVCIHSFNSISYPLLWLAIIAAGGIVTGSNPAYTSAELIHHFKITNTSFVLAQSECAAPVKEAILHVGIPACKVLVLGNSNIITPAGFTPWNVLSLANSDSLEIGVISEKKNARHDSIAVHAATSGTTGLPKAAELSHQYVVAQVALIEHVYSKRKEKIRQLVCLPVFHAFAAQLAIVVPLRLGFTTYFMPRFNLDDYLNHVQQFQITDSAVVPPIVSVLLNAPQYVMRSLRYMICAGAPMTASVQTKLYSNLHPSATIAQCWGTTECGWATIFDSGERDYTGSVGRLLPSVRLKIVDEYGQPVTSDNRPGEALVKSSSMFIRYRGKSDVNAEVFDQEGYYRTGDRVYVRDGKIYISGRIKDIMKVKGWQVSPEEIELVILEIDGVIDCAVVGRTVTNSTGLEETQPQAFVVKNPNTDITGPKVKQYVSEHLVTYKRLTGGVVFVDNIPRSNTGKIQRRKLLALKNSDYGCGRVCRYQEADLYLLYVKAAVLVPLSCAMVLPGFVLMCVILRAIAENKHWRS